MQRFWLLFTQTVTISLALWFIIITLKPNWIHSTINFKKPAISVIQIQETSSNNILAPNSYRNAARQAMPSVVNIFTTTETRLQKNPFMDDPFFKKFFGELFEEQQDDKQFSLGSGVIVSPEGYILTNNHVVEAADKIEVALTDGRKISAKVVGTDTETDLAVIKINLSNLPTIILAHPEQATVGDTVLAIGNPFGVGQTVTMGIISALGRNHLGINTFENFIQTDAAINPGNSGGALVDTNGNLLGINTAIYSRTGGNLGIGFAIPVSTAKNVMEAIINYGQVIRGWIGVEPQDITPELAESFNLNKKTGAIIASVLKNSPADKAGIQPGDILIKIENKPVIDTNEMLNLITQLTPGQKAKMTILRRTKVIKLNIIIGKRPPLKHEAHE